MQAAQGRYNIYRNIHKALRAFMCDTLVSVGSADWQDAEDSESAIDQIRTLLSLCASHVQHENDYVHTAMESRWPRASAQTGAEHGEHVREITDLLAQVSALEAAQGRAREVAAAQLYRHLACFIADNLQHMEFEEKENNAVLWATHNDEEIHAIEQALVASIPPATMGLCLRWMLPSMNHGERVAMLRGMQASAPVEVFAGTLQMTEPLLSVKDWDKLCAALDLVPNWRAASAATV